MRSRREALLCLAGLMAGTVDIQAALARCLPGAGEPIHEQAFVPIGGIDQWIEITGADRRNPVPLVVNGGPGSTWDPFADLFKDWAAAPRELGIVFAEFTG